jgi:DNA-binding transcriptional ArsR family regulator
MRLPAGSRVRLLLLPAGAAGSLSIGATVIWSTEAPGWRHGLAFATADAGRAAAWFDELIAGTTRILHLDRGPDRIGPGDRIYVARAPQEPTTSEEALVLRLASARVSMAELCAAFGARWSRIPRALLSLLDRGLVAIEREGTGATGR